MKLSLASLLVALAVSSKSIDATQSIHEYATFDIVGASGEMPPEETAYFQNMFVDTYNLVHSHATGEQTEATSFVVETQQEPTNRALRGSDSVHRELPGRNWGGGVYGGNCYLCYGGRKLEGEERELETVIPGNTAELHRRFEKTMAAVLREGPYSYFEDVTDVVVDFSATQN